MLYGVRIIPTRMGTSCDVRTVRRLCQGSSPRVWGQASAKTLLTCCYRIIPTRMGTRLIRSIQRFYRADHPHAYGDKTKIPHGLKHSAGSSPRVWGQAVQWNSTQCFFWIIPTRMGTRNPYPTGFRCFWDHPHAYGDKQESLYAVSRSIGSSPRVWGQGIQHSNNAVIVGLIPTRMGTSALFSPFLVSPWDHPHAYGDK